MGYRRFLVGSRRSSSLRTRRLHDRNTYCAAAEYSNLYPSFSMSTLLALLARRSIGWSPNDILHDLDGVWFWNEELSFHKFQFNWSEEIIRNWATRDKYHIL